MILLDKEEAYTPFSGHPIKRRTEIANGVKTEIAKDAAILGGLFTTDHRFNDPNRPHPIFDTHLACQFLSKDPSMCWWGNIATSWSVLWSNVQEVARQKALCMLNEKDRAKATAFSERPRISQATGEPDGFVTIEHDNSRFDVFGGLTLLEYASSLEAGIIASGEIQVHESFTVNREDHGFPTVEMVIDAPMFTIENVTAAIKKFLENGEVDFKNPGPIPQGNLPQVDMTAAYSAALSECRNLGLRP